MQDPAVEAVDHHRRVDVLEHAALDQLHLAAAPLLGRRADHLHAPRRQLVAHGRQRGAGAGAGRRDDVVTAGVADGRQRVVLAEDRDGGAAAVVDRAAERRGDASHPALDLEALRAQEVAEPAGRLDLLETEFRIVVDLSRKFFQVVGQAVHRLSDEVLDCAHGSSPRDRGG